MSVNQLILDTLASLGIPVVPDRYTGEESRYCVFNYNTAPADYGDDDPKHERYLIQVHLFAPIGENILEIRRKVKRLLHGAGLTWPVEENATETYETTGEGGQHYIFECEYVEGIAYG